LSWSRLLAYFTRFKLCPDLSFGLEILAPSLERVPIFIRPKPRASSSTTTEKSPAKARKPFCANSTSIEFNVDSWRDVLSCDSESGSLYGDSEDNCSGIDSISSDAANKVCPGRMELVEAAKAYWPKRAIVPKNVAISCQKIRQSDRKCHDHPPQAASELQLEVNMVVCPISALQVSSDDSESEGDQHSFEHQQLLSAEEKPATLELVRMVNDVPLLDGAEAHSCGLVHGLENKTVWGSFGLEIRRKTVDHSQNWCSTPERCKWTPTFELQDHKQVAAYIQKDSNHKQLRNLIENYEDDSDAEDDDNLEERPRLQRTKAQTENKAKATARFVSRRFTPT
jgi:hypothetical protein